MDRSFLVLGGAGLVGFQVARRITEDLDPERIVLVSRTEASVAQATERLREIAPGVDVVGEWGDVFLREGYCRRSRSDLLADAECREGIFADLLGPIGDALSRSRLAALITKYRPDVIVDSINTATAISYQDVYAASVMAKRSIEEGPNGPSADRWSTVEGDVEALILSQSEPQLIRHVLILDHAMRTAGSRLYLKVGTTGTGGMGLNIPYTHSEDRPSAKLMTKTAVAFAHTGLLFLMARTEGGPLVKEVKPGALIGYARIAHQTIRERGEPVARYRAQPVALEGRLELRMDPDQFEHLGEVALPIIDTGENGVFTRGEFEAITAIGQMEFVTPEEIADICVREIRGGNTGRDVIAALDASILGPSYRAGVLRHEAIDVLANLEVKTGSHSVALGQLGPPELSKLLWEAELLRLEFGTLAAAGEVDTDTMSRRVAERLAILPNVRDTMTSLGLGILTADGAHLVRGPFLRIPEIPGESHAGVTAVDIDDWAEKGWIDLRAVNFARWQKRF
ncbi:MAG: hypothetical protein U9O63_05140, partial [Actinomycetota bacterium]|nr:hypothetical protein [Actinomycetota bacterium]